MKTKRIRPHGFTLVELLVVIVIIAALAGLSTPVIIRQKKAAARAEAISNAKQLGLALLEFDNQYGSFPDNHTADQVVANTGTELNLSGNRSNDYLRQLLATSAPSEEIFFAKTSYTRKPDNVLVGDKALEASEVGFGYIMKDTSTGQSSSGNPACPLLAAPLLDAQEDWTFDPETYGDKAVILRIDQSARSIPIRQSDGKAVAGGGKPLEQTGADTVWGTGTHPVLKAPAKHGA